MFLTAKSDLGGEQPHFCAEKDIQRTGYVFDQGFYVVFFYQVRNVRGWSQCFMLWVLETDSNVILEESASILLCTDVVEMSAFRTHGLNWRSGAAGLGRSWLSLSPIAFSGRRKSWRPF